MRRTKFTAFAALCVLFAGAAAGLASAGFAAPVAFANQQSPKANRDALIIQGFQQRVAQYVKLHNQLAASLPAQKSTASVERLNRHQNLLADKIRAARKGAKEGAIFTPETSAEFKRLIRIAMRGQGAKRVHSSLRVAERAHLRLHVNQAYPPGAPLGTTPPTLLQNLPRLPKELDYRLVGRDLVLRDVAADLIVDIVPAAIPPGAGGG